MTVDITSCLMWNAVVVKVYIDLSRQLADAQGRATASEQVFVRLDRIFRFYASFR
jgi:hypothetical protein